MEIIIAAFLIFSISFIGFGSKLKLIKVVPKPYNLKHQINQHQKK